MGMYSGIGTYLKSIPQNPRRFEEGGAVTTESSNSGETGGNLNNLTYEQYLQYIWNNVPAVQNAFSNPQAGYQAYLNGDTLGTGGTYNAGNNTIVGGPGHTTNGSTGGTGGPGGTGPTLPAYMSFGPDNKILIPETTTNREFIEAMNLLGLLSTERGDGQTDYEWLLKWLGESPESGNETWLAVYYNNPDEGPDRGFLSNTGEGALNDMNKATMRRLLDLSDNASAAGGFVPTQTFLNTYGQGTVGTPGGTDTGGTDTGGTGPIRPIFSGVAPTVGAGGAYYSPSDILVSSDEQPNLYGYGYFNPYSTYANAGLPNPYESQVNLNYAYQPPDGTPPITTVTNPTDPVDGVVDGPGGTVDPVDPVNPDPCPAGSHMGPNGYCIPDACPPGQVRNADGVCVIDNTGTNNGNNGNNGNNNNNNNGNNNNNNNNNNGTNPGGSLEGYHTFADFKDYDDYLHKRRGMVSGIEALAGSQENITAEQFQELLSQQEGKFGEGSTMAYDPRFGIYSTMTDDQLAQYQAGEGSFNNLYINPEQMSDVDRIKIGHIGTNKAYGRKYTDSQGRVHKIGVNRQTIRIGDKQYFVNEDGTVTAYTVRDIQYGYTPQFGGQPRPDAGFAEGGIVTIAGDIADMQTTGEGIESFLNPARSKATLRRNLAKLALPPTAPAPTMQQGIMPMAR